jgi:hypothetical protein
VQEAEARQTKAPRAQKFGNQVVESEGERFGSKWELARHLELQQQEAAGLIAELRHHVPFPLHAMTPAGRLERVGVYEADFAYRRGEQLVVEDTKSAATRKHALFRWKAQHFELEYGLQLAEVTRAPRRRKKNREVIGG